MTRSALLNLMLLVLLVCGAVTGLLWWYVQRAEAKLIELRIDLETRKTELANLHQMTEAQTRLDALTLDERTTTQLELLKHLGLEKMELSFEIAAREEQPVGDTSLITRGIVISLDQSYPDQMAFIEKLYGNGKLQIAKIELRRAIVAGIADPVALRLEGKIYSIEKKGPIIRAVSQDSESPMADERMPSPTLDISGSVALPAPEGANE
jgi:hypothetical protein